MQIKDENHKKEHNTVEKLYLFHSFPFLLLFVAIELGLELKDFTLFGGCEVAGVRHLVSNS